MDKQTNDEEKYLAEYPVINDVVLGEFNNLGIDPSKYYFSEFTMWEHDKDITYYCVYYGSVNNENVTLGITLEVTKDYIHLEEFNISLD